MSKGLNVIIGDNSIGKSLFLHAITNNTKINDGKLKKGYEKYLEKNNTSIKTKVPEEKALPQLSVIIVISHVPQLCFKQLPATSSIHCTFYHF